MSNQNNDAEAKLQKLGHHLRLGWDKQPMDTEKNQAIVREAVKEQWQKERTENLTKPATPSPAPEKSKEAEPPEPDLG
jgi:hypothetical protein